MTVLKTHISWTDSTWNPTVGCTKVSAGCDNCYAEAIVRRQGLDFATVRTFPARLATGLGFGPVAGEDGRPRPRLVFVNSMSDLFHEQIGEGFRGEIFDTIDHNSRTIFQVLTKRPMTMARVIEQRYAAAGVPRHLWLGVSAEDNRVKGRLDQLRRLKERVGNFTAFVSVEPLIGPVDRHDYTGLDWVLIGGESIQMGRWRKMDIDWARQARDQARAAGAAIWFKQFGMWQNNPLYRQAPAGRHWEKVRWCIANGECQARLVTDCTTGKVRIEGEKGGATLDDEVLHELPPAYHALRQELLRTML